MRARASVTMNEQSPQFSHTARNMMNGMYRTKQKNQIESVCIVPRTGRLTTREHWMGVELGTILMKFAFTVSVLLWSRIDSSVVPLPKLP